MGVGRIVPGLGVKFDVVLAFSVFTHMHQKRWSSSLDNSVGC